MTSLSFLGGLLLGLTSSLHCAGMCGSIGAALTLSFGGGAGARGRLVTLLVTQLGKTVSYVLAGALVGALGSLAYVAFNRGAAFQGLQWLGAAALAWTALALIGWLPSPARLDGLFAPLRRRTWSPRSAGGWPVWAAGLVWGALPCGMVYSALLYAMMTGDPVQGGLVMLGFGLGVVPSVTATAMGVSWLPRWRREAWQRYGASLLILIFAGASLFWPAAPGSAVCAPVS